MKRIVVFCVLACVLMTSAMAETVYPDGIYRGFYYDGGIEQIALQFEIKDGVFNSIVYRGIKYKDGDYMIEDASDAQKATLKQYRQLADHLIGKGVDAIADLYYPYDIVDDVDAVTTATIQSSKLISALWDGLNRKPFKLVNTTKLPQPQQYLDGIYRGSYMEGGVEEVAVEFRLQNGCFESISFRGLSYKEQNYLDGTADEAVKQVAGQFQQLLDHLTGQPIFSVNDLYQPGDIVADVDGFSGATIRAPKVISAIWDALNRNAYRLD